MKKVIRSIVIFWGIVSIFLLCYLIYNFFTEGEGSYWIFGARDGQARVITWLDKNANGIKDTGEPPLPGVCIWSGFRPVSIIQNYSDPCKFSDSAVTDEQANGENSCPVEAAILFMSLQNRLKGINSPLI